MVLVRMFALMGNGDAPPQASPSLATLVQAFSPINWTNREENLAIITAEILAPLKTLNINNWALLLDIRKIGMVFWAGYLKEVRYASNGKK